jgi:hypothetical protein
VTSPLENLCGPGQPLRKEAPDAKELAGLQRSGLRRLADAEKQTNSAKSRFDLGVGPEVWRVLARCHELRNRGEYEGDLYIDERLVTDLINACKIVATTLHKLPPLT